MGRLSPVEIDIFLTSASPGQQAIVRTLREIITRRAGGLAERVNTGKSLKLPTATKARPKRWGSKRRGAG